MIMFYEFVKLSVNLHDLDSDLDRQTGYGAGVWDVYEVFKKVLSEVRTLQTVYFAPHSYELRGRITRQQMKLT